LVIELVPGALRFTLRKKNGRGTMKVEVPKIQFSKLINELTWSNGFCGEGGKRSGLVGKGRGPCKRYAIILIFYYTTLPPRQGLTRHTFQHLYDVMHLEKQVHPLYA
jgi:hypothetical protein